MKFSERVSQLTSSPTLAITSEATQMRKRGLDVIDFGAGEPDFDTPPNIKKAAIEAIKNGFTKYTASSGIIELKNAVSEKLKTDNSLAYPSEQIVISCGAKHALYNIFQVLCNKGDEVLIISPYWVSYPEMVKLSGASPRIVSAKEADGFVIDPKKIEKNITKRTKAIIINSPSNPTGAILEEEVLKKIAKIAISRKIFVISDEIYEKFIYNGARHISIGSLNKEILKLTLTVNGVSKTYSMTGWRIGYVAGPLDIIKRIAALQSHSTSNPSSISQMAALAALTSDQESMLKMKREFALRRDYMVKRVNSSKIVQCIKPKGAFYIFCNISNAKLDSVTFCRRLLNEVHVACIPGIAFGSNKHIRLSFATSMKNIEKGLHRIENWLNRRSSEATTYGTK